MGLPAPSTAALLADVRTLIDAARQRAAAAVNAELTLLYWHIGRRIRAQTLQNRRAEYGQQVVETLSAHLTREYGKGWGERQLWLCLQVADCFPDETILHTLCRELSWSHLRKYEQLEGETAPIGLILCTGKNEEHVELMRLDQSNIRVADYLTLLPPREILQARLHQAIEIARQRLQSAEPG